MLHEQVAIPGSELNLVYLSSRAPGYKPILKILLTQERLPFGLMKVHLMVAVMGRQFQKAFPAFPNLSYTFIWDKTDAYGQKVYGLAEAMGGSSCLMKGLFRTPQPAEHHGIMGGFRQKLCIVGSEYKGDKGEGWKV